MPGVQYNYWLCTLNNHVGYAATLLTSVFIADRECVRGLAGQAEKGANGTPHLQFVVRFKDKKAGRFVTRALPGVHCIAPNGTFKQNVDYCTKKDTREKGPWLLGYI